MTDYKYAKAIEDNLEGYEYTDKQIELIAKIIDKSKYSPEEVAYFLDIGEMYLSTMGEYFVNDFNESEKYEALTNFGIDEEDAEYLINSLTNEEMIEALEKITDAGEFYSYIKKWYGDNIVGYDPKTFEVVIHAY